jgi:hypothetical protein
MIGTSDQTVIVRIPIERAKVRFGGEEREVIRLAQGFCFAEYGDGNVFPISNPLEQWLLDVTTNQGVTPGAGDKGQQVYFVFEAAGPASNDGQGTATTDVTNIQTGL